MTTDTPADTTLGTSTDVDPAEASTEVDTTDPSAEAREAQKYRKRAQQAEGERDTLRTQLEQLQRAMLDTAISQSNIKPEAVWAAGITTADLLTDGQPDPEKISTAIATTRTTLGIPARPKAATDGTGGNRGDDIEADDTPTWQTALRTK